MDRRCIAAILAAAIVAVGGCAMVGLDNINMNNTVPVFERQTKVIDGITYTKVASMSTGRSNTRPTTTRRRATRDRGRTTRITAARRSMSALRGRTAPSRKKAIHRPTRSIPGSGKSPKSSLRRRCSR